MLEKRINLSKILGVKPKKAFAFLKVALGKEIKAGEVIACRKTFFGKKELKTPFSGKLIKYEESTGDLVFEPLFGTPKPALLGEKWLEGEFGFGGEEGEVFYSKDFTLPKLDVKLRGKILLVCDKVFPVTVFKAGALGVKGIVCGRLDQEVKKDFLEKTKTFKGITLLSLDFLKNINLLAKIPQGTKIIIKGEEKAIYKR